ELPAAHRQARRLPAAPDPLAREAVAPRRRLVVDGREVGGDRGGRRLARPEALELRMLAVAGGPTAQHRLGEQPLAPQRDEAAGIEVLRVQAPQAHRPASVAGGGQPGRAGAKVDVMSRLASFPFLFLTLTACAIESRSEPADRDAFLALGIRGAAAPMDDVYCSGQPTEEQFAK